MGDTVKKYHENKSRNLYPGDIIVTQFISNKSPIDKSTSEKDQYVQSVKEKFEKRSQTGIKKYNTTLERTDLNLSDWLLHAQEEAMDFTLYLEKIMSIVKKKGLDKLDAQ
tara:strand:+ start:2168 stop:2497 length:330 start_codon:yes stop_codon:yes gene_type:complete